MKKAIINFNAATHEYTDIRGKHIPSVTEIVGALYPSAFANIPAHILEAASRRGTSVHLEIENYEKRGIVGDSLYFSKYMILRKSYRWTELDTEKVVSAKIGKTRYAGTTDKIIEYAGQVCIADVKCVSKVNYDKLKLQLSLYSHAAGIKAGIGYLIWLPSGAGDGVFESVPLYTKAELEEIIKVYENGGTLEQEAAAVPEASATLVDVPEKEIKALSGILGQIKAAEKEAEEIKGRIFAEMQARGIEKLTIPGYTLSVAKASVRKAVDSKKLKTDFPDVWEQVQKETEIKEHLTIREAKNEGN